MKPKTLLVLTALVAVLAAFIWFFERDLPSSEERAERATRVLPLEPDEVAAVEIDWGGERVRLERRAREEGEGEAASASPEWRMTEPFDARADRAEVDTLLDALTGLRKSRTLEDVEGAEVGLDTPRGGVTLTTVDGESRLLVGAGVPGSDNVIVALDGEDGDGDAWVTSGSFLAQLEREPSEWRSREVITAAREDVETIRLRSHGEGGEDGGEPVVLVRRGERFHLESPFEDPVSSDAAERLLADLVTLRARTFLDDAPRDPRSDAGLGLAPPRGVVEAELAGGGSLRVELGAPVEGDPDGAVHARVGDLRFQAVTGLSEAVARPAGEWRSPSWTTFRSFEVDRVEVEEPGAAPLALSRAGVDWKRGGETIPYTAASDLLFALTEAEGTVADGEPPAESTAPLLTVRLASDEGEEETLTLFPAVPDGGDGRVHPARSSARTSGLLLPASVVTGLTEALEAVRNAEPEAP